MDDRPKCFCGGYREGDIISAQDPVCHTPTACNTRRVLPPEACETCRFWTCGAEGQPHIGRCRRYPMPQPLKKVTEWCGEHRGEPTVVRFDDPEFDAERNVRFTKDDIQVPE